MSGNGIRCFAQAPAARRGDMKGERILTDAGERRVTMSTTDDPQTIHASVDMGAIEAIDEPEGWDQLGCHPDRPVVHLGLGNPHSVVGVEDVTVVDLLALGLKILQVNLEVVAPGEQQDAHSHACTSVARASPRPAERAPVPPPTPPPGGLGDAAGGNSWWRWTAEVQQ